MNDLEVYKKVMTSFKDCPILLGIGGISRHFKHLSDLAFENKTLEYDDNHFYLLGTMGAEMPVGLGLSLSVDKTRIKKVIVMQGDGGFFMSIGSIGLIHYKRPKKLVVFIMDNKCYASTGGQPAISKHVDVKRVLSSFDVNVMSVKNTDDLNKAVEFVLKNDGPHFVHVDVTYYPDRKIPPVDFLNPPVITHRFKEFITRNK